VPEPAESNRTATPTRPDRPAAARVAALDPPMVPFAVAGVAAWTVAGLVLLLLVGLGHHVDHRWLWTCLAGVLLGLLGLAVMIRHDRGRARRHTATKP
jgi:hypothetical protein